MYCDNTIQGFVIQLAVYEVRPFSSAQEPSESGFGSRIPQ